MDLHNFNPSTFLFPIAKLSSKTTDEIEEKIERLSLIYSIGDDKQLVSGRHNKPDASGTLAHLDATLRSLKRVKISKENVVADSGYASADEDDNDEEEDEKDEEDFVNMLQLVRSNTFERDHVISWLTGLISRSSSWIYPTSESLSDEEVEEREALVEKASALLSSFAGMDSDSEDEISREFTFPLLESGRTISIDLNDKFNSDDHDSVGLQSWASAIHLARLMAADPTSYGIYPTKQQRVLELGAGTGLLSIVTAKIINALEGNRTTKIVATDYHSDVLENLRRNVNINFTAAHQPSVDVKLLDWQYPTSDPPFDSEYDTILAADVVYHPSHATWIKGCVSNLLKRPSSSCPEGGVFWMIIAIRNNGRHEGLANAVLDIFPLSDKDSPSSNEPSEKPSLKVVSLRNLERTSGIGRTDESGYRLFKISWV